MNGESFLLKIDWVKKPDISFIRCNGNIDEVHGIRNVPISRIEKWCPLSEVERLIEEA